MTVSSKKILDQIPLAHIYKYLAEKENASKAIATHCKSSDITNRYVAHQNGVGGTNLQIICKIFKQII